MKELRAGLGILPLVIAAIICVRSAHGAVARATDGRPREVPADATRLGNRWFKIYDEKISWDTAKRKCEHLGGRLAVVPDQATWSLLSSMIGKAKVWLGASDAETEGRWVWVDGTPMGFAEWMKDQPNNRGNEDYLHTWDGEWNDIKRDGRWANDKMFVGGYVCEWVKK